MAKQVAETAVPPPDPRRLKKEELDALKLVDVIRLMDAKRSALDAASETTTLLQIQYDQLRIEVVPSRMEDEGIERLNVAGVGRVSLTGDMHVSVPAALRGKFYEWLRTSGFDDLIVETVNSSTLKAWCKEQQKMGKAPPDDLIKITPFTRASITKG